MNVNKGLDKEFEQLPFGEIIQQPVHALHGITPAKGEIFSSLGVKAIDVGKQVYVHMKMPTYNGSEKSATTDSKASNQVNQRKEEKGQQEAHFYN